MRFGVPKLVGLSCLLPWASLQGGDFALDFDGCPPAVEGLPGEVRSFEVYATIAGSGAAGWVASFVSEGGRILGISTYGIAVHALRADEPPPPSEIDLQLSDAYHVLNMAFDFGERSSRALSSVVLDSGNQVVLDSPGGPQRIARFLVETTIREEPFTLSLRYADGLFESESGGPIANSVTVAGVKQPPILGSCAIQVLPVPQFKLALAPRGESASPSGDTVLEVQAPPGEVLVPVEVRLSTTGLTGTDGPQGWSLSIQNELCMQVERVTVNGLSVKVPALDDEGHPVEKTVQLRDCSPFPLPGPRPPDAVEVCSSSATGEDPSPLPDDARGVVSAAVLSSQVRMALRPNVTETVLSILYRIPVPEEGTASCRAYFSDGLRSARSQPVPNVFTYQGASKAPTSTQAITILVSAVSGGAQFVRGDSNDDGKVDIADAIWTLQDLFQSPVTRTRCRDGADGNDDGAVDISDPVYLLGYLFHGGPRPAEPYPSCGRGERGTAESCPAGSTSCP